MTRTSSASMRKSGAGLVNGLPCRTTAMIVTPVSRRKWMSRIVLPTAGLPDRTR
jgi:hypothetical protein